MPLEIERKFLVIADFKPFATYKERIIQAYLSSAPDRTVRIRIKNDKAYLTIKGKSDEKGISRYEWEKEIGISDAHELFKICEEGSTIDKIRYIIPSNNNKFFEVDEFLGENKGLIVAEIELSDEKELFDKPEWLGREVTGDIRYYNSYLSKNPYKYWNACSDDKNAPTD